MRHMGMILAAGLFAVIGMTGIDSEANGDWRTAYAEIIKAPEEWLDTSEPVNGWNFELLDLDEDGTPELVVLESIGARGITGDIYVFGYDGTSAVGYTVESDIDFSILGDCKEYRNQITGQKEWLMNLERFRGDSIQPGGYLESSAGQGGIAGLIFKPEEKKAMVYTVIDSEKNWGITAEDAGAVLVREPWGENCITEEAYDKIQNFIGQYEDLGDAPSVYIGHGNTNTTTDDEIYSMLNSFGGADSSQGSITDAYFYLIHTGEMFATEEEAVQRQTELSNQGITTMVWSGTDGYRLGYDAYYTRCLAEKRAEELNAQGVYAEIQGMPEDLDKIYYIRESGEFEGFGNYLYWDYDTEHSIMGEPSYLEDDFTSCYEGVELFGIPGGTLKLNHFEIQVASATWETPIGEFSSDELQECMIGLEKGISHFAGDSTEGQDLSGNPCIMWDNEFQSVYLSNHAEGYLSIEIALTDIG